MEEKKKHVVNLLKKRSSNSTLVMRCYNYSTVPVLSTLALNFTLFDTFHSSVPGPTGPNRMFFHSGTSHGAATNLKEYEIVGYPQRTFFKDLVESGKSFGIYFEDFPVTLELRDVRDYPDRFHIMSDFLKHARRGELPDVRFFCGKCSFLIVL